MTLTLKRISPSSFLIVSNRRYIAINIHISVFLVRPLAGYCLPLPRGNFVDHIFREAQCLAMI